MKRIVTFLLVLVMVAGMIPATVWAAEAYTITFDPNGGTCATETVTVNEGEAIGTLPVPVREDSIFKGWYLDVENGTRITEEDVFTESTTLYAKWAYSAGIGSDFYAYLGNKASGIGLVNNGFKVELGERYSEASRWHFVMQEDYTFKVISAVDGTVLDVTEDGAGVCTAPDTDAPTQRWLLNEVSGGYPMGFSLYSVPTGRMLTVVSEGAEFVEGDGVQMAWEDGSDAQILYVSTVSIHYDMPITWELYVGEEKEESIGADGLIDFNWYFMLKLDNEYVTLVKANSDAALQLQFFTLMPKKVGVTQGVLELYDGATNNLMASRTIEIRILKDDKSRTVSYYDNNQLLRGDVVTEGATITIPKDFIPTKAGYLFHSWNTDYDYLGDTYMPGDKIKVNGNINLYAEWRQYDPDSVISVTRIFGSNRYNTALAAADQLKENLGVEKFENIVVACGTDFADALSGSYLANQKNAPILLVNKYSAVMDPVKEYIRENLTPGGTVYLLGGTGVMPAEMETGLEGFEIKRLQGANRYMTNLEILKEAGVEGKPILVCTGLDFADGLSAAAVNQPILLVTKVMLEDQIEYLDSLGSSEFYIIGGTGAVNEKIEAVLKEHGSVQRIEGANRYVTSVNIAKTFFPEAKSAVLAYAYNFPDGLSGGCLAHSMGAPLILTNSNVMKDVAAAYVQEMGINGGAVLGGTSLISDTAVRDIFNVEEEDPINVIK